MTSGLIDVHAHLLPDFYVERTTAVVGHTHPDGMGGWPSWSVRDHLALMDGTGRRTPRAGLHGAEPPGSSGVPAPHLPTLLKLVGPDRVLFGSDYCWTPAPLADAHVTANATRLFPQAGPR